VVVLSSSRHPGDIRRSYEMHANAYIVKPTDFDGFEDMMKRIDACFLGLIEPPPPCDRGTRARRPATRAWCRAGKPQGPRPGGVGTGDPAAHAGGARPRARRP
jgi:DNA-binding NarL/FixJ family response regulator